MEPRVDDDIALGLDEECCDDCTCNEPDEMYGELYDD